MAWNVSSKVRCLFLGKFRHTLNFSINKGVIGVSELVKITEEEKIAMDNDFDPIEAPPGPYKIQPEVQGE